MFPDKNTYLQVYKLVYDNTAINLNTLMHLIEKFIRNSISLLLNVQAVSSKDNNKPRLDSFF